MLNPQKWSGTSSVETVSMAKSSDSGTVIFEEKEVDEKDTLSVPSSTTRPVTPDTKSFDQMQLLVSLDTALELIHADRDSLKRCETFASYPGKAGNRVREAIEEIFVLLLKAVGDRHIAPGFRV